MGGNFCVKLLNRTEQQFMSKKVDFTEFLFRTSNLINAVFSFIPQIYFGGYTPD